MTRTSWYLTETFTLIQRRPTGAVDAYGNDVFAETQVPLVNCRFDPKPVTSIQYANKVEATDREDKVTDFGTIFIEDPATDIQPTDRVILDAGAPFDVVGPIGRHTGTRMGIDFCSANVKRVTG